MRRAIALMFSVLVVGSSAACVTGGANEEPTAPRRDGGFGDDFIDEDEGVFEDADEDAPFEDADDAADDAGEDVEEDTATPDDADPTDADPPVDTAPPADTGGCTPSCTTCGGDDGCGTKCLTGTCGVGQSCVAGTCVTPTVPTRSFLAPGDYAFGAAWARPITWTIDSEGPARIFYTLDGSAPGPTSPNKVAPADLLAVPSGTTIRWYADNGARESPKSFLASVDTAGRSNYGFIVERANLNGSGPVVVVAPNATVSGTASYEAWTGTSCPLCALQLVYGIGANEAASCMYHGSPGNYGTTGGYKATGSINVQAPAAPGTYDLNVTYTLQNDCAGARATDPLLVRPTARIGVVIVK